MTLFDFLDRVAFLRGETAALLVVATAVALFILPDIRLGLFALAAHYFAAALLFVDVLDPRLAIVKLLTGWFVCLMLYLTGRQVNWGRPPADLTPEEADAWPPPPLGLGLRWVRPEGGASRSWRQFAGAVGPLAAPLALAAAGLVAIWLLSRRSALYLPALPETLAYFNLAVYALVGFGLLHMSRSAGPLTGGLGAFLFLSGVELYYSFLDQNVAGLGLLAALNLTVALAIGSLTQAHYALPLPPRQGRYVWERATAVAGLVALVLLAWWFLPGEPLVSPALSLLLGSLAALYLFALLWPQSRDLVPITLAATFLLGTALLVEELLWGGLLLLMGVLLLAAVGQVRGRGDAGASWRYLVLTLLALPFLLLAGWQAGLPGAALPLGGPPLLAGAAILLLGGFPASLWVRPLARRAAPLLWPFLFGGAHLAIVAFLFGWLAGQPAWAADAAWRAWLTWGGVAAALWGGLLAALSQDEEELLPSLLLLDMGFALLLLLRVDGAGWETAVAFYRSRIIGLLLIAVGWGVRESYSVFRKPYSVFGEPFTDHGSRTTDNGQRITALLLRGYGALTLLGLPLTLGFAARWSLLSQLEVIPAGLLLLATLGGLWGLVRRLLPQ